MAYVELTDANFDQEVLQSDVPVMVDFWAPWCGPCQMTGPAVEALGNEMDASKVKIAKLNVDEHQEAAQKYNVLSIPTFLMFKGGQVVDQTVGGVQKEALEAMINKHI